MTKLSKVVECFSNSARKLELTLILEDGTRQNFRFAEGKAQTSDVAVLRCLMAYSTRNKPGDAGFIIGIPDDQCLQLIAEADAIQTRIQGLPKNAQPMKATV
jgi:hypothetical protein